MYQPHHPSVATTNSVVVATGSRAVIASVTGVERGSGCIPVAQNPDPAACTFSEPS